MPAKIGVVRWRDKAAPIARDIDRVWLKARAEVQEADALTVRVERLVTGGVPLEVKTRVILDVKGRARRVELGRLLLEGTRAIKATGSLPVRATASGIVEVFAQPGRAVFEIDAVALAPQDRLALPAGAAVEIWRFVHQPEVRVLKVSGARAVHADQSALPQDWPGGETLEVTEAILLEEVRRGDVGGGRDEVELDRTLWLDFDGRGFTVLDRLGGTLRENFRLRYLGEGEIGRVTDVRAQRDLLVTTTTGDERAVELRTTSLDLQVITRAAAARESIKAVGWDRDLDRLSVRVNAPPGWQLLTARGPDRVTGAVVGELDFLKLGLLGACLALLLWLRSWRAALVGGLALLLTGGLLVYVALSALALLAAAEKVRVLSNMRVGMSAIAFLALALGITAMSVSEVQSIVAPQTLSPDAIPDAPAAAAVVTAKPASSRPTYEGASVPETLAADVSVQTGPGLTSWSWNRYELEYRGVVDQTAELQLYWLSPGLSITLSLARVLLSIALLLLLLGRARQTLRGWRTAALPLAILLFAPAAQADDFPSSGLLEELERRALDDKCAGPCVTVPSARVDDETLRMEVHAQKRAGVVLVGSESYSLLEVRVDGRPTRALRRDKNARVLVRVPAGIHEVTARFRWNAGAKNPSTNYAGAPLRLSPRVLEVARQAGQAQDEVSSEVPPWFFVERRVEIGFPWKIVTTISRPDTRGPARLTLPLVDGEKLTLPRELDDAGDPQVTFGAGQQQVILESTVEPRAALTLTAPRTGHISETWVTSCSRLWRCTETEDSIAPTQRLVGGRLTPLFQPWPGESLTVEVTRARAARGPTLTIESVDYDVVEEVRSLSANLTVRARASTAGWHTLRLPKDARLKSSTAGGTTFRAVLDDGALLIPMQPGLNVFKTSWTQAHAVSLFTELPAISVEAEATDVHVRVAPEKDRVLLFTGGPRWGPFVFFGLKALALLLFGLLLARFTEARGAMRVSIPSLFVGLVAAPLWAPLLLSAALVARVLLGERYRRYSVFFVVPALLVGSLYGLAFVIDPLVFGIGSTATALEWFIDRLPAGPIEGVYMVSIDVAVLRAIFFAWTALWVVGLILKIKRNISTARAEG